MHTIHHAQAFLTCTRFHLKLLPGLIFLVLGTVLGIWVWHVPIELLLRLDWVDYFRPVTTVD